MKEECHRLLKQFQISHYFVHLPLDYADFGTCNSLFNSLEIDSTENILDAVKLGCDAYITGEKTLYSIQYAQYVGMNLVVGNHTFTEIFGVRSLANQFKSRFSHIETIELTEDHFE